LKIHSLNLTNYRNWADYHLDFNEVTILIGPNGAGKTNILESVYFLATGRTWRASNEAQLINWENDYCRLTVEIEKKTGKIKTEIFLQKQPLSGRVQIKQVKINNIKHRTLDLIGQMPAVLFSPETIDLISGAPNLRRKFLDIVLAQTKHIYALNLLTYQKVLRERNKLLFHIKIGKAKRDELDFWNEKLVETGESIIRERSELIKKLNQILPDVYATLVGEKQNIKIVYKPSVKSGQMKEEINASIERDIEKTGTGLGPHRDDWEIQENSRNIVTFASRGEFRSAVLALKCAEVAFIKEQVGEDPVLLLDDIFSELDATRRAHLAKVVETQQTIITTTDLDHIEKGLRDKAKIVEL
jgi:DNA replication and repair protein RecF